MRPFLSVSIAVAAAVVVLIVVHNIRGRRRERKLIASRGEQTAAEFAALFEFPTEQLIAANIFPYLQLGTFTNHFAFRRNDRLWEPPLNLVQDDLEDRLRAGFWDALDLGLTAEDDIFTKSLFSSAATVGELVEAITVIYTRRYGSVRDGQRRLT